MTQYYLKKLKETTKEIIDLDLKEIKKIIDTLINDELSLSDIDYHQYELDELLKDLKDQINDYIDYRFLSSMNN